MRQRLRWTHVAVLAGVVLVSFLAVVLGRTALYAPVENRVDPVAQAAIPEGAAERLAAAIRFATISSEDPTDFDGVAFNGLHEHIQASFPRVHAELRRETVATHSVLYTWPGSDPDLAPILLAGHLDVVPVESGSEAKWREDPFGGRIIDGVIWGRGAIDNKSTVFGVLEAAETLLNEGFRPARTIYFAFGHDEEVGGRSGAEHIAALLQERGVQLDMVLDEGGVIAENVFPGVTKPVALIGIAEKGFVTIELTVRTPGGHSSLPPPQSAIGIVSAAVARLEARQMRPRLTGAGRMLFDRIGRELPFVQRVVFANLWLTQPLVIRQLESTPTTNAMIRTTTAATVIEGGTKDNVLPSIARAVVNFRILPGDSIAGVLEHVERAIDDPRVQIQAAGRFSAEPSRLSSAEAESYRRLERAILTQLPEAIPAPYLVVVVTDSRHFARLSTNIYRFSPLRLTPEDIASIHGVNERIAVSRYEDAIGAYRQIMLNVAAP